MADNHETVNYDEGQVGAYTLPEILRFADGRSVTGAADWPARRAEILHLFEEQMYGRTPRQSLLVEVQLRSLDEHALEGRAVRKQVRLLFGDPTGKRPRLHVDLLIYLPAVQAGPVPLFLSLNFAGNHAIHSDPGIFLCDSWLPDWTGSGQNRASEDGRGRDATRWPVERILERGYGLATAYYGDLDPDFDDGFQNGIQPFFYAPGQTRPEANEWGAIGAWAWGLSRMLDYLETDPAVDAKRVAVLGHSRLGKAALWAGVQDERFALVISNNSGCGGAALSRRNFGETIGSMNDRFPHWLCSNFRQYNGRESELPIDQHMLIALVAPRPVYIASAAEDLWADPRGEFLSGWHASPLYCLLGTDGLAAAEMPGLSRPVFSIIGYHLRPGKHDVTDYDWSCYMDFADRHMK